MTGASSNRPRAGAERPLLIVLNNDGTICEDCYEPQNLEVDPGLIPGLASTAVRLLRRRGRQSRARRARHG